MRKGYPDFTIFYSAGTMVRPGMAGSLYDERAEFQTQRQFAPEVSIRHGALPYNHPPFEALLFVPLSFLPYLPAYLVWDAVNLGLLVLALLLLPCHIPLLHTKPLWVWVLCAVAFFPIFVCLLQGQDMIVFFFLLAAAYGSLKNGADFWAGCWLGMGLFRPHLVLPLAVILLFSGRRKAVLGVASCALVMAGISIAVIGWRGFLDYPGYVWRLEQIMGRGAIVPDNMPNLRGFLAIFFRDGHPTSAAILVTILISYHAFIYDLGLLLLPALLLLGEGMRRKHWELIVPVVILFFTPLLMFLWLRLSHLNLLTPVLFLWLWGMARDSSLLKGGSRDPYPRVASGARLT